LAVVMALAVTLIATLVTFAITQSRARAATAPVNLGTAGSFAVLGGQAVTNTGPSVITGDVGVSPGTAITGFPPGTVFGATHSADAVAAQAQTDLTTAYNDAAGRTPATALPADLGGLTLTSGVYNASSSLGLTGTVTLDGQGDPNAVFIIQVGSALTTASGSVVNLINGAQACNVFWQIGSSATLGTSSTFVGNILALTSIAATTNANINGRLLARNGSVTLDSNVVSRADCLPTPTPTVTVTQTVTASPTVTVTSTVTATPTATVTATATTTVTATATATVTATPTVTVTVRPPARRVFFPGLGWYWVIGPGAGFGAGSGFGSGFGSGLGSDAGGHPHAHATGPRSHADNHSNTDADLDVKQRGHHAAKSVTRSRVHQHPRIRVRGFPAWGFR
jgi:hypothetical protein